jgi:hypothetical protein
MALKAQGIKLKMGNGASTEVFTLIPDIVGFEGPDGEAAEIDTSTLDSVRKEFMMGLPDEGRIVARFLFDPADTQHQLLITNRNAQTAVNFKLDYNVTPAEVDSFSAYVLSVTRGGEVDGRVEGQFVLRITGVVTNGSS